MKPVLIFPVGALSKETRSALSKAGVVAIEAPDPASVVWAIPHAPVVSGDDLLAAAMLALKVTDSYNGNRAFVTQVNEIIQSAAAKRKGAAS